MCARIRVIGSRKEVRWVIAYKFSDNNVPRAARACGGESNAD